MIELAQEILREYGVVVFILVVIVLKDIGFITFSNSEGKGNKARFIHLEESIGVMSGHLKDISLKEDLVDLPGCIRENTAVLKELVTEVKYLRRDSNEMREAIRAKA